MFVVCDWRISIHFVSSAFRGPMFVTIVMIDGISWDLNLSSKVSNFSN